MTDEFDALLADPSPILRRFAKKQERIAELEAAIDSAEVEGGISSEGNLWRFWSKKAADVAVNNKHLRERVDELEAHVDVLNEEVASIDEILREVAGDIDLPETQSVQNARDAIQPRALKADTT